jgi:hypothetical protein
MIPVHLTPQERDWLVTKLTGLSYSYFKANDDKDVAITIADKARAAPVLNDGCEHTTPPRQVGAGYTSRDEHGNPKPIPAPGDELYGKEKDIVDHRLQTPKQGETAGLKGEPSLDCTIDPKHKG